MGFDRFAVIFIFNFRELNLLYVRLYAGVLLALPWGIAHADPIAVHSTLGCAATHVTSLALMSAVTVVRFVGKW